MRPGLQRAIERIARGEASCLVVAGIDRVAPSAAALGGLLEWFEGHGARLIVPDLDLVTGTATGGLAARALSAQTRSRTQQSGCVNEMWPSFIHQ